MAGLAGPVVSCRGRALAASGAAVATTAAGGDVGCGRPPRRGARARRAMSASANPGGSELDGAAIENPVVGQALGRTLDAAGV